MASVYDIMMKIGITEKRPQNARRPSANAGCRKGRARYVGRSGDLLPPSPPGEEKTTASED
jgi:hypothetical protein